MPYVDKVANRNITLIEIRLPETENNLQKKNPTKQKRNHSVFHFLAHKNICFLIALAV